MLSHCGQGLLHTDLTGRARAFNVHLLADPSEKQGASPILVSFTPTEHQEEEL